MSRLNQKGYTLVELFIVIFYLVMIPVMIFGVPWLIHWFWMNVGTAIWHWPVLSYWQIFVGYLIFMILTGQLKFTFKSRSTKTYS